MDKRRDEEEMQTERGRRKANLIGAGWVEASGESSVDLLGDQDFAAAHDGRAQKGKARMRAPLS